MIILFNKPFNVLSQFTDGNGRKTLADYITAKNVYAAGRLDYDSEGLIILTDDGKFQNIISDPKHKLVKTYLIQVEGIPKEKDLYKLRKGVILKDGITKPAEAKIVSSLNIWERTPAIRERKHIPTSWIELKISEGKNRQVRRMTASIGYPTLRLIRTSIGKYKLNNLRPGDWKEIKVNL